MCCKGFLKIIMFIINFSIFAAGGVILGVGVWVVVDSSSFLGILETIEDAPAELAQLAYVGYLLIGVGAVLVVVGFLGCCGAVRESRCMLLSFTLILLVIFIAEVAGAVIILHFQPLVDDLLQDLGTSMVSSLRKGYGHDEGLTSLWNSTMDKLQCCGYHNYTDFDGSPFVSDNLIYPLPCCNNGSCDATAAGESEIDGCFDKLVQLINDNAVLIGGVALGVAAVEIAAMVVSVILYKDIGRKSN